MLSKSELLDAIKHCEDHISDFKDCERLASLYVIYNQRFRRKAEAEPICEVIVQDVGDSEFLSAIRGKSASEMWLLMDDLMQTLEESNPKLHDYIMNRI